jgi:hypothetical protein
MPVPDESKVVERVWKMIMMRPPGSVTSPSLPNQWPEIRADGYTAQVWQQVKRQF